MLLFPRSSQGKVDFSTLILSPRIRFFSCDSAVISTGIGGGAYSYSVIRTLFMCRLRVVSVWRWRYWSGREFRDVTRGKLRKSPRGWRFLRACVFRVFRRNHQNYRLLAGYFMCSSFDSLLKVWLMSRSCYRLTKQLAISNMGRSLRTSQNDCGNQFVQRNGLSRERTCKKL